jgi:hypothetical protein
MMLDECKRKCRGPLADLSRVLVRWRGVLLLLLLLTTPSASAAGGGKKATKLVQVVDTRAMEPGFTKWTADVYNESLWAYGLLVVATMTLMGVTLGFAFDRLVGLLGIDLGKLRHHE